MVISADDLRKRASEARRIISECRLCPRACLVNRIAGQVGWCGAAAQPGIGAVTPHFGEEPPLVGQGGAGTIFFTQCNLRCVYCQNHQISGGAVGKTLTPSELARNMIELQALGCSTIEAVSPSHHLPGLLEALACAREEGLLLPFVYNTNAYEAGETLDLLEDVVDVYLPDLKYASDSAAFKYSQCADYVRIARTAILKMYTQVGDLAVDSSGCATRGLILRHLVLPGDISGTTDTLWWIFDHFPNTVTLSLMAQYLPLRDAMNLPPLDRPISEKEYDDAIELAVSLGFENVFIQTPDCRSMGIPDFSLATPFDWTEKD